MDYKHFFKSKTLWAGISTIALGLGMYFSGENNLQELLISVVGVIFTILRFKTDKPLGGF